MDWVGFKCCTLFYSVLLVNRTQSYWWTESVRTIHPDLHCYDRQLVSSWHTAGSSKSKNPISTFFISRLFCYFSKMIIPGLMSLKLQLEWKINNENSRLLKIKETFLIPIKRSFLTHLHSSILIYVMLINQNQWS